mmetsp:Transcript_10698/g.40016  ORF Transcript_10698/g.40016 Transcript_10698/m.40016 type:complete len:1147 (-) Transcript_10698:3624-7064(-)|eukprot:CAMPEP_0117442184 /NCGR_PEP_ID=MMETSP0759-20121206/4019_1 /TAXON_ID=63605 /ORGANISM="Percolomonas cosmopolitus, Strain WS" /LENGTH=1146 /DNA_ID=CAMNT_0005234061 /DNA_START=274 /DNA_END=3714 /DNA_ORIENTATION=+
MPKSTISTSSQSQQLIIGKKELLSWASQVSQIRCVKFDDLSNGVVFLRIFERIWPKVVDLKRQKWKPNAKSEWESKVNWDLIKVTMVQLKLPMSVYQKKAIQAGRFKQCYAFLVMLYFLHNLSENHEFSVDFAHPIDGNLAAFLQSPASVESLARGGALMMDDISSVGGGNTSIMNDQDMSDVLNQVDTDNLSQYSSVSQPRRADDIGNERSGRRDPTLDRRNAAHVSQSTNASMNNFNERPQSAGAISQISTNTSIQNDLDPLAFSGNSSHRQSISSIGSLQITNQAWDDDPMYKIEEIHVGNNKVTTNTQTLLTSRKIEKILIRSMKTKRMLEEAYGTIEKLSKGEKSLMNLTSAEIDSQKVDIIWKNQRNKLRGELLLTKMRYEIESLNRKITYLTQQKEFGIKQVSHKLEEQKAKYENEILYQRDQARSTSTTEQLMLLNERLKDREDFELELRKIRQEIAFEADRIRQGGLHADDDDAIEDEILRLRQLTLTQSNQIKTIEESNTNLNSMVKKLQDQLREAQDRNKELHNHFKVQEETLIEDTKKRFASLYAKHSSGGNVDMERMLLNISSDNEHSLSKMERLLLLENRKMQDELNTLRSDTSAEIEHIKHELFKYQQKPASKILNIDAMEAEFDRDQKMDRLQSEVDRLKRVNNYLRDRSVVFDKFNEKAPLGTRGTSIHDADDDMDLDDMSESHLHKTSYMSSAADGTANTTAIGGGAGGVWTPSLFIGDSASDMDDANGKILTTLRNLEKLSNQNPTAKPLITETTTLFWKMISDQAIFIQRIKKSRSVIFDLHNHARKLEQEDAKMKAEHQSLLEKTRSQHRIEMEDLKHKFIKEQASLIVKLQLTEDALREARDHVLEVPQRHSQIMEHALQDDERRFTVFSTKLREAQEEIAAYRLREKLWTQLIECQRKNIELTEKLSKCQDYNEAVKLNKQREALDLEATSCVQQLQALTQQHHQGVRIKSQSSTGQDRLSKEKDLDSLVQESTKLLRTQLEQLTERVNELLRERESYVDRASEFEHQAKNLQFHLAKEQKAVKILHTELNQLVGAKTHVVQELNELKDFDSEQVRLLKVKIDELSDQIGEMRNNPDSYFYEAFGTDLNASRLSTRLNETMNETSDGIDSMEEHSAPRKHSNT